MKSNSIAACWVGALVQALSGKALFWIISKIHCCSHWHMGLFLLPWIARSVGLHKHIHDQSFSTFYCYMMQVFLEQLHPLALWSCPQHASLRLWSSRSSYWHIPWRRSTATKQTKNFYGLHPLDCLFVIILSWGPNVRPSLLWTLKRPSLSLGRENNQQAMLQTLPSRQRLLPCLSSLSCSIDPKQPPREDARP